MTKDPIKVALRHGLRTIPSFTVCENVIPSF